MNLVKKFGVWILVILIAGGASFWLYKAVTRPLPGEQISDLGREHVKEGSDIESNSNPPTSGDHFEEWTKAGVYDKSIPDGYLVHSLEHGYVVLSYNCEGESPECKELVSNLTAIYEKKGRKKLIVIPRPSLDARIALTAWRRIDKFDDFDEKRIERFIDAFRNRGPEQTME